MFQLHQFKPYFPMQSISFGVFLVKQRGTEEAPENGKESSHSAHASEMECICS
jgi:hypothetical protein